MEHLMTTSAGREWLQGVLRDSIVEVIFTKRDGTERTMKCTLKEGIALPHDKTTDRTKEANESVLAVWDVEKSAWRSFRLDTIKSVILS